MYHRVYVFNTLRTYDAVTVKLRTTMLFLLKWHRYDVAYVDLLNVI